MRIGIVVHFMIVILRSYLHTVLGMPNIGALKNHFENKHPKLPLPPELLS